MRLTLLAFSLSLLWGCDPPAVPTVEEWLLTSCAKHDSAELTNLLKDAPRDSVVHLLDSAWKFGAPQPLVLQRTQASEYLYQLLQSSGPRLALYSDTSGVTTQTQAQFVNREIDRFKKLYHSRALLGIAVVADTAHLAMITAISLDSTNPDRKLASNALRMRAGYYP